MGSSQTEFPQFPRWKKLTSLTFADFSGVTSSKTITVKTLANGEIFHGGVAKYTQSFAGLGMISWFTRFMFNGATIISAAGTSDGMAAVSNTNFIQTTISNIVQKDFLPTFGSGTIDIEAICGSGVPTNVATQGAIDIWIATSLLP